MKLKFWGVRGSIPTPGPKTVRYGGNTPCIEFRPFEDDTLFILDCGTGLRELGMHLMATAQGKGPIIADIFLSHTHWDHLHGFPFFVPAFIPGNKFFIRGPVDFDERLEDIFKGQMKYQYFPVKLSEMASTIEFEELKEGTFFFKGVEVQAKYLNHPILVLGYRFVVNGKVFVYATDTEPYYNMFTSLEDAAPGEDDPADAMAEEMVAEENMKVEDFCSGADLVIYDAQYTEAEYAPKRGWGHTAMEYVIDSMSRVGVKAVALFHHDPTRTDEDLEAQIKRLRERASGQGSGTLKVFAAWEGQEVTI